MTRDELVAYCLRKPGVWLDEPWPGDEVAKVADKIFAFLGAPGAEDPAVGLKCGPTKEAAEELRLTFPGDVTISAYIGRYGWNSLRLAGSIPAEEIRAAVDASYDAIVAALPRAKRPG